MGDIGRENILVTGFGPFRDHNINASWEAVKQLPNTIHGYNIVKLEIPVAYDHIETNIPALWKQLDPILVVHVGVSSFSSKLTLEKCANREGYTSLDCSGNKHPTGQVCCEGDDCIFTGLDLDELINNLKTFCSVEACTSNNAGKYLCEFIYYTSLINNLKTFCSVEACTSNNAGKYLCEFIYYTSLKIDRSRTLFIHVPPIGKPYSSEQVSDGIRQIVNLCLRQVKGAKPLEEQIA